MKYIFTFAVLGLLLFGCKSKDDSNIEVLESYIYEIESPANAVVGDNVEVKIHFTGPDGCAKPYSIEAVKVGQDITLKAYYYTDDENQFCTQSPVIMSLDYTFFADLPGPYFFTSEKNSTISDTLVVQ